MGGMRGRMGISYLHSHGGGNVDVMAHQRRLGSLWSFLRQQDMMSSITEMEMAMPVPMPPADVGESIAAGNGLSDLLRIFSMSTWDDTNSNIMFSAPGSKKAEVLGDSDVGMVTSFSNIDSQLALSSWTCPAWTTTCSCSRTPPTAESTPSVAAPLIRRASLGRERRTRINQRLRRLQDLIPYMDKVTRTEYTRRRNLRANISAKGLL
uniref:BHLH domain-containing protein n=1 Tax=Triticum aestivum TaxID=4565 RepID=A0A3B6RPI5_WHEAT